MIEGTFGAEKQDVAGLDDEAGMTLTERLVAALQWCSGSEDFGRGGKAEEGWKRIVVPLLEEANECDPIDRSEVKT